MSRKDKKVRDTCMAKKRKIIKCKIIVLERRNYDRNKGRGEHGSKI